MEKNVTIILTVIITGVIIAADTNPMSQRYKNKKFAGAYISGGQHRLLSSLAKRSNRTLAQYSRHLFDAVLTGQLVVPDAITSEGKPSTTRKEAARA